jgi:hypothetical protein
MTERLLPSGRRCAAIIVSRRAATWYGRAGDAGDAIRILSTIRAAHLPSVRRWACRMIRYGAITRTSMNGTCMLRHLCGSGHRLTEAFTRSVSVWHRSVKLACVAGVRNRRTRLRNSYAALRAGKKYRTLRTVPRGACILARGWKFIVRAANSPPRRAPGANCEHRAGAVPAVTRLLRWQHRCHRRADCNRC